MSQKKTNWQIFIIPLFLFIIGMAGLILALVYTGAIDFIATLAVAIPIGIIFYGLIKRKVTLKHKKVHP